MSFKVVKDWTTNAGPRAVVVMTNQGHHCGYVGVPPGHPLHDVGYDAPCPSLDGQSPEAAFDVHGGLTYSDGSDDYPASSDGLWWFGYDCAHFGDRPSDERVQKLQRTYPDKPFMWMELGEFRDLAYCERECESLARQIVEKVRGCRHG